jgi:hypothetical protein
VSQTKTTDLEPLRHSSGLICKISIRERPNAPRSVSFMIAKEFEREGRTENTAWLSRRHLDACREFLDEVEPKLDEIEDRIRAEDREHRRQGREAAR